VRYPGLGECLTPVLFNIPAAAVEVKSPAIHGELARDLVIEGKHP
jgi:hypothetical protein